MEQVAPVKPIVGLLLAAGRSRRFGSDKLLQPIPGGDPMIVASARQLALATDRCIALVRSNRPQLRATLERVDVEIVEVANADAGMGTTLAAGVQATAQAAGWVIALADMPSLRSDTVRQIVRALRGGASIAAPFHGGRRGHPVGFAKVWLDALTTLDGDTGARDLLQVHSTSITRIDVDDPGCLFDVDTPSDLKALGRSRLR